MARIINTLERLQLVSTGLVLLNIGVLDGKFFPMQFKQALAILAVSFWCLRIASAQIIFTERVGDKEVTCVHSGLTSTHNACGVRPWYSYTFVGSISKVTVLEKDEKEIQIVPEEIFQGAPPSPLTIRTSQAWCLPKLAAGDRWLFFLKKENDKPIVLDYGGNDESRPVEESQKQIETLRRLKAIGDFGLVRGRVLRGRSFEGTPVRDAHIVASREADKARFEAKTDTHGSYEFPPLPPGKYKLIVDPIRSYQPDDNSVEVGPGSCWDVALSRSPHAQLSGHVRYSDGSPVPKIAVLIAQGNLWNTTTTDEKGYFHADSLAAGQYIVGINLPSAPAWEYASAGGIPPPAASLYYSAVTTYSAATPIRLATDEKRKDIDFVITAK